MVGAHVMLFTQASTQGPERTVSPMEGRGEAAQQRSSP